MCGWKKFGPRRFKSSSDIWSWKVCHLPLSSPHLSQESSNWVTRSRTRACFLWLLREVVGIFWKPSYKSRNRNTRGAWGHFLCSPNRLCKKETMKYTWLWGAEALVICKSTSKYQARQTTQPLREIKYSSEDITRKETAQLISQKLNHNRGTKLIMQ